MATMPSILIVDDEDAICFAFERYFSARGFAVRAERTFRGGLAAFEAWRPDVVFLDVRLGDGDGLAALERMRAVHPASAVIVISAYGSLDVVTRAVRGQAFDFLVKPLDLDRAAALVDQALASRAERSPGSRGEAAGADTAHSEPAQFVGSSPAMREVFLRIGKVAATDANVLILGQTGTGKERVAWAIHEHSRRADGPFVPVNCGALPENLVESELFGYVRGAFTGADADKIGRFEAAGGGTLFLDEVGELPPAAQVKLLRFLDNRSIERLGSVTSIPLNVRVLAATNRDLPEECRRGRFRSDLFYRLAVVQIALPPLRDRPEDILPLADHFLRQLSPPRELSSLHTSTRKRLTAYDWPGNVRELQNAIQHAAIIAGGGTILPDHLPQIVHDGATMRADGESAAGEANEQLQAYIRALPTPPGEGGLYAAAVTPLERALILHALNKTGGNQSQAADLLGLHRNTLRNKLKELGLDGDKG
ncbi:MAG: sigma-54 dependent transcriptional regulator [Phycisphaerae bacterium]|nr:sigma-54 dependent transcriptional regulator [Phycisphaerae bacterium]